MQTRERNTAVEDSRRKTAKRQSPEYTYTEPRPFHAGRFFLRLATAAAIVFALIFGISIFFKVDKSQITVSGASKYKPEEVIAASGIQDGDNLLTLSQAGINGKIITQLPYVDRVRVGIKLPDTVNIEIVELDVAYAIGASDETWWLMDAGGRIVDEINAAATKGYTCLTGVQLEGARIGSQAVAAEVPPETTPDGETVPVTVRGSDRMNVLLSVLRELEDNGILGQITEVDVTDPTSLKMQYGTRFSILLGDSERLDYKMRCMKAAIAKMQSYESGELDVSFTVRPDEVIYTPIS